MFLFALYVLVSGCSNPCMKYATHLPSNFQSCHCDALTICWVTTVDILEKMKTLTSSQLRSLNSFKELASNSNIYDLSQNVAKRRRVANNIMFTLTKKLFMIPFGQNREGTLLLCLGLNLL